MLCEAVNVRGISQTNMLLFQLLHQRCGSKWVRIQLLRRLTSVLQVDDGVQRVLAKERASQSKALELQSQLSRARTEQSHLQRSKAEVRRDIRRGGYKHTNRWCLTYCFPPDGASVPESAAEHEGQAGAVGLHQPQSAELRHFPQNLVWKRVW